MTDQQSQTTANPPSSEPRLCRMGCGFFGNGATDNCCSKCWRELQKKQGVPAEVPKPQPKPEQPAVEEEEEEEQPQPMEVDSATVEEQPAATTSTTTEEESKPTATESAPAAASSPAPTTPKKKKKKTSYKNMMAGIRQGSGQKDTEKEKEALRKVTGGGHFSKIDKI